MDVKDAANFFGSEYKLARALKIHQANITRWQTKVPEIWARRLHDMTEGKLRFIPDEYRR